MIEDAMNGPSSYALYALRADELKALHGTFGDERIAEDDSSCCINVWMIWVQLVMNWELS
jgi:hypothetical protein